MAESVSRRGRPRDPAGAKAAILDAAELVFAGHGFAGARVDAIARESGYNAGLIFHYFGDKLGLYVETVRRADRAINDIQGELLAPFPLDETITLDPQVFTLALETFVAALFDYLVAHPRFARILLWEQAAGWQTFSTIAAEFAPEDRDRFNHLFLRAHDAGIIRSSFAPLVQISLILQLCLAYLSSLPLYERAIQPTAPFDSPVAHASARHYIVGLIVHGILVNPPEMASEQGVTPCK